MAHNSDTPGMTSNCCYVYIFILSVGSALSYELYNVICTSFFLGTLYHLPIFTYFKNPVILKRFITFKYCDSLSIILADIYSFFSFLQSLCSLLIHKVFFFLIVQSIKIFLYGLCLMSYLEKILCSSNFII
jgi:hypothetical protein